MFLQSSIVDQVVARESRPWFRCNPVVVNNICELPKAKVACSMINSAKTRKKYAKVIADLREIASMALRALLHGPTQLSVTKTTKYQ